MSATPNIKEQARQLIDSLPDETTWEELIHTIYVRQAIEKGLKDSVEGNTVSNDDVRRRFGLDKP